MLSNIFVFIIYTSFFLFVWRLSSVNLKKNYSSIIPGVTFSKDLVTSSLDSLLNPHLSLFSLSLILEFYSNAHDLRLSVVYLNEMRAEREGKFHEWLNLGLFASLIFSHALKNVFQTKSFCHGVPKTGKGKSLRRKPGDLVLLTTMTSGKVHIYDETEELTTRASVCWREGFETVSQREKVVKDLYDQHQKEKTTAVMSYRAAIQEWISTRRTWKYTPTIDLYLVDEKFIVWPEDMIEQDLINYNTVLNNPIDETLITAILNETTKNKNESEADILAYAISTLSSDSSQTTKTTVIMTSSHIMTRTSKKLKAVSSGSIKTRKDNGTSERTAAFGSSRPYHTQLPTD